MAACAIAAFLGAWSQGSAAFLGLRTPVLAPPAAGGPAPGPASQLRAGAGGTASSSPAGLPAAGLALCAAAAWRWAAGSRSSGRVIVRGRNYETNIKKKKGPAEARKAKVTAKHLKKIVLCIRESGPDPETNPPLARQITMALKDNVPRSTIDQRIQKYVNTKEVINEVVYGGYSQGGAAVMVQCVTDNNNRTRTEVREAFKEAGGQIGTEGCVDHLFNKQGVIRYEGVEEEAMMEAAMEGGAEVEDVIAKDDGSVQVITLPENYHSAMKALGDQGMEPTESDVLFEPVMTSQLNEANSYELQRLLHYLGEVDDVQDVHHNGELMDVELKFSNYGIPLKWDRASQMQ